MSPLLPTTPCNRWDRLPRRLAVDLLDFGPIGPLANGRARAIALPSRLRARGMGVSPGPESDGERTGSALADRSTTRPFGPAALAGVAAAYYVGAVVGFVLRFPPATTSVLWPPNAILTAAAAPRAAAPGRAGGAGRPPGAPPRADAVGLAAAPRRRPVRHELPGGAPGRMARPPLERRADTLRLPAPRAGLPRGRRPPRAVRHDLRRRGGGVRPPRRAAGLRPDPALPLERPEPARGGPVGDHARPRRRPLAARHAPPPAMGGVPPGRGTARRRRGRVLRAYHGSFELPGGPFAALPLLLPVLLFAAVRYGPGAPASPSWRPRSWPRAWRCGARGARRSSWPRRGSWPSRCS